MVCFSGSHQKCFVAAKFHSYVRPIAYENLQGVWIEHSLSENRILKSIHIQNIVCKGALILLYFTSIDDVAPLSTVIINGVLPPYAVDSIFAPEDMSSWHMNKITVNSHVLRIVRNKMLCSVPALHPVAPYIHIYHPLSPQLFKMPPKYPTMRMTLWIWNSARACTSTIDGRLPWQAITKGLCPSFASASMFAPEKMSSYQANEIASVRLLIK